VNAWIPSSAQLTESRTDHIIVTLANVRGSAPQVVGSKMLITDKGLHYGTVGGGKIEAHCIRFAQEMLKTKSPVGLHTWNLQKDIGMSCGGEVTMLFEPQVFTQWVVAIFGAGHCAQELCRVMQTWSCSVQVFDHRQEWIDRLPKSINIKAKCIPNPADEVSSLPDGTFLLSMTQGHAFDVPILTQALKQHERFAFLGVIGSRIKGDKIRKELRDAGVPDLGIERLVCPVGLPIGDNTPPEISISIAAQLIGLRPQALVAKAKENE
jgi:xanthine dehydrogenase accessory factor